MGNRCWPEVFAVLVADEPVIEVGRRFVGVAAPPVGLISASLGVRSLVLGSLVVSGFATGDGVDSGCVAFGGL